MCLRRVERALEPFEPFAVDRDHVEAARRRRREARKVTLSREHQAALLGDTDAGRSAAEGRAAACTHLDEDQRAVPVAHHQVDLAAARAGAGGDPIIAFLQVEAVLAQMCQCPVFAGLAGSQGRTLLQTNLP